MHAVASHAAPRTMPRGMQDLAGRQPGRLGAFCETASHGVTGMHAKVLPCNAH